MYMKCAIFGFGPANSASRQIVFPKEHVFIGFHIKSIIFHVTNAVHIVHSSKWINSNILLSQNYNYEFAQMPYGNLCRIRKKTKMMFSLCCLFLEWTKKLILLFALFIDEKCWLRKISWYLKMSIEFEAFKCEGWVCLYIFFQLTYLWLTFVAFSTKPVALGFPHHRSYIYVLRRINSWQVKHPYRKI